MHKKWSLKSVSSFAEGVLNSYAQVFFSQRKSLAVLLLLLTFIDYQAGISGLFAVVITQLTARVLGLDDTSIQSGLYSFNSLSVGLCLGVYFNLSLPFLALVAVASLLSLLLTVWIGGALYPKGLPYLSFPFIITIWLSLMASRSYEALMLSERGIYIYNELYTLGGQGFVDAYMQLENSAFPLHLDVYLRSLGALFFQYNLIAGFIAAVALLIYSRIAFAFSLTGFYTGFMFYHFLGGNITELTYSFIGFNFILTAIALGGFFLIPSAWSFLLVMVVSPLIALLNSALSGLLWAWQLPLYSMPFNLVVIGLLYLLRMRSKVRYLFLTPVQHYSPEINLYSFNTGTERFKGSPSIAFQLPFYGRWTVTQAYNGKHTHREAWRHALDFMLCDENGETHEGGGFELKNYFGWQKPVLAPADGLVVDLHTTIDENQPGKVNLENNWGNSVVIKHGEQLYSQISHLLTGSFRVHLGQYVKKGEILALLGNSGRSPLPHIHFQIQSTPYVGSATVPYPFGYYLKYAEGRQSLMSFSTPVEGDQIQNVEITPLLRDAYSFIPGQILQFKVTEARKTYTVRWEVRVSAYNQVYLYCFKTRSVAYLHNNGTMFYFLSFHGDKKSLLYHFYLSSYQVLLGFYPEIFLRDTLPVHTVNSGIVRVVQDFLAPFVRFLKVEFQLEYTHIDNLFTPRTLGLRSEVRTSSAGIGQQRYHFEIHIAKNQIDQLHIKFGNRRILAERQNEYETTEP